MTVVGGIIVAPSAAEDLGTGITDEYQPGTGTSAPGGVESVLEYNGLYMNVRRWVDTYVVTEISGLDGADVRDAREVNPGADGETAYDAHWGGRTIVITGYIRAVRIQKLRDMIQALKQAFGDINNEHPLTIRSGAAAVDTIVNCKITVKPDIPEVQNSYELTRRFQITLRSQDHRIFSYERHIHQSALLTDNTFSLPMEGNAGAPTEIYLTGPIVNPTITLDAPDGHQHVLALTTTIPSGETWVFDSKDWSVKDGSGNSKFKFMTDASEWIVLHNGLNLLTVTGTGLTGASYATIYYRDAYL